jgi:phosphoribosyl-AMP cyclohydrolase
MLPQQHIDAWIERLRQDEPDAVAIVCCGSYARGTAEAHSDLDLEVLVQGTRQAEYRSAFEELPDGRLLHVTIAVRSLADWLAQFAMPKESKAWAFFLPAREGAQVLWATPEASQLLEGRITLTLHAAPQLQDLLECAAKARNARARGDDLGVRLAAQGVALGCPAVLGLVSPSTTVYSARSALDAALDVVVAPPSYRDDMLTCLGMSGSATSAQDVHDASLRLSLGCLALLQVYADVVADRLEPGLPEALADGRLTRLLTQP